MRSDKRSEEAGLSMQCSCGRGATWSRAFRSAPVSERTWTIHTQSIPATPFSIAAVSRRPSSEVEARRRPMPRSRRHLVAGPSAWSRAAPTSDAWT
jgi:hypothetical protein